MTLLDVARRKGISHIIVGNKDAPADCPDTLGIETKEESEVACKNAKDCEECWKREVEFLTLEELIDPEQRIFDTGAVRDSAAGKGRYDLLPWNAIHALAQHCERGAEHYGEHNVDKGIPQKSLIDSACRHLRGYITGDGEDYHLVAALWNIAWAVEQEMVRPEMVDIYARGNKAGKAV